MKIDTKEHVGRQFGSSDILNAFDGITCSDDRILILTSNDIKSIDESFLRPGRIDYKYEITYVDK